MWPRRWRQRSRRWSSRRGKIGVGCVWMRVEASLDRDALGKTGYTMLAHRATHFWIMDGRKCTIHLLSRQENGTAVRL